MFCSLVRRVSPHGVFRLVLPALALVAIALSTAGVLCAQDSKSQSAQAGLSNLQRMDIMRSKLDAMRRTLDGAIAAVNTKDTGNKEKNADDPRTRLRGLDKEVGSVLSEINDLRAKEERADKYDTSKIDGLEVSVTELNTRVEAALQATAAARTAGSQTTSDYQPKPQKNKRRFLGLLPGKSNDKYAELTGTVAPGRDRVLFVEAAHEVRKGNHETGRLLFTTIITTYPDSPYLAMAKLAIADSFYLEGTTSSLIQAGQAYQDWLTFFPTDALTCDAMLKVAETEMRQMGLSDRDITHARKAEQRLKVMLQQCPQSSLRPQAEVRLRETQDSLAMHNLQIARFYLDARYRNHKGGLKGGQDRLKEILEKYKNFCLTDEVLFRTATTYQEEEEPDEAAKYYQQLVRDYPNSDYLDKAKDQLNIIGAAIPDPDPIKKDLPVCEKLTFMQNMMQQISGSANVTTSHDGILITKKGEGNDLIDKAIQNNGQLPDSALQPVIQRAPTRQPLNQATPTNSPEVTPDKKKIGISVQPTSSRPLPDQVNPATPPATRPRATQTPTPKP
ncbi:MAG TPA: outer membrane protein assembly factor BamD [Pyrinomonadaceae bacterium]|nr:outer membrane protein assembly factor BamD [Pyrinomonadaceae bacterium]